MKKISIIKNHVLFVLITMLSCNNIGDNSYKILDSNNIPIDTTRPDTSQLLPTKIPINEKANADVAKGDFKSSYCIRVAAWEPKKDENFNTYFKVKLINNTNKIFVSYHFTIECGFEDKVYNKNITAIKKERLNAHDSITFILNPDDLNSFLKNAVNKPKYINLNLDEALDDDGNTTASIEQGILTQFIHLNF